MQRSHVRHVRFDVASLAIERVAVPLRAAYLLVAENDDSAHPQWECVAYSLDGAPVAQGRYRVDVSTLDGRYFQGEAALVRSVDGTHVLRGTGALDGLTDADLG